MPAKRELEYVLKGREDSSLTRALRNAGNQVGAFKDKVAGLSTMHAKAAVASQKHASMLTKFSHSLVGAVTGAVAAYVSINTLVGVAKESIAAYQDAERASARLEQTLSKLPGTTAADVQAIDALSAALMRKSTLDDDAIKLGASQLATFGLQADSIKKLLPSLVDLATGTYGVTVSNEQMTQSADLIGKAAAGNVGSFQRLGIILDEHQKDILKTGTQAQKTAVIITALQRKYGGQAITATKTAAGQAEMLKVQWGNALEQIGEKLQKVVTVVQSYIIKYLPAILKGMDRVFAAASKVWQALQPAFRAIGSLAQWTAKHWSTLAPIIYGIVGALGAWRLATEALTAATAALAVVEKIAAGASLATMISVPGLIAVGVGILIGAIYLLWKNWDKVTSAIGRAWAAVKNFANTKILEPIIGFGQRLLAVWNRITSAMQMAWAWIKRIASFAFKASPIGMAVTAGKAVAKVAGKRAEGGSVAANRAYLVGERGPEIFVPKIGGTVLAGAGGINVSMTVNVTGGRGADVETGIKRGTDYLKAQLAEIERERQRRSYRG